LIPAPSPSSDVYLYWCNQSVQTQQQGNLTSDTKLRRDRDQMDRFMCEGALRLTIHSDQSKTARVVLIHMCSHQEYCDISLPAEAKLIIHTLKDLTVAEVSVCIFCIHAKYSQRHCQIWSRLLGRFPKAAFSRQQVYAEWSKINEGTWKLNDDQYISSRRILERHADVVEVIPVRAQTGISVVAFALKKPVQYWGKHTIEVAIDGTCE